MVDVHTPAQRSRNMAAIKGKNTKPELAIRKELHRLGYRFRVHNISLPGSPDIVLPKYKAAIQVHGCFWHGHDCHLFNWPSTREEFWRQKITSNQVRDAKSSAECKKRGWKSMVIWECALKGQTRLDPDKVVAIVANWLKSGSGDAEISGT